MSSKTKSWFTREESIVIMLMLLVLEFLFLFTVKTLAGLVSGMVFSVFTFTMAMYTIGRARSD